jgi:hypothetical protein
MTVLAVGARPAARQRHLVRAAEMDVEPVVMQPDAQAVADQARGHAVEHLAQDKAARGGHGDDGLLVVGGAAVGQVLEARPLGIDPRAKAGVLAPDDLVDEPAVGGKIVEVAVTPQQQRILDGPLEMAVRALDRAVLVGDAGVVAAGRHPVVSAERVVPAGHILLGVPVEVAEGRRQAVAAMLQGRPAERP